MFFALLLGVSALAKIADMPGFFQVVATYQVFPEAIIPFTSWALVALELSLGVALLVGKHLKTIAGVVVALHLLYFIWLSIALLRGLNIPNCGCFGVYFARPLTGFTILEDGFLLFLSAALWQGTKPLEKKSDKLLQD
jgi:Methylamine utilisation protein MauE